MVQYAASWRKDQNTHTYTRTPLRVLLLLQLIRRWEANLVVMDDRPFPDLQKMVAHEQDERIWVFAEWVSCACQPATAALLLQLEFSLPYIWALL
jgi:hypothetical protein